MTIDPFKVFLDLHLRLPRQGPGSRASTKAALELLPNLPDTPEILDMGCGSGTQTLDLLDLTNGNVTVVDMFDTFLDLLSVRADAEKIPEERLTLKCANMAECDFGEKKFDLIWSEGAIYAIGFANGLKKWQSHLKPNAFVVVSELTWFKDDPPEKLKDHWANEYPDMETVDGNKARAEAQGYEIIGTMNLPAQDWWDNYYGPQRELLPQFQKEYDRSEHEVHAMLADVLEETNLFEEFSDFYGYTFYALTRRRSKR